MSCFYYYRFLTMNLAAVQIQYVVVFALASCVFFPFVCLSAFIIFPIFPALIHIYFFFVYGFQLFFISLLLATSGNKRWGSFVGKHVLGSTFLMLLPPFWEMYFKALAWLLPSYSTILIGDGSEAC